MQKYIIYKNSKIAYSDIGKGSTIVLLHGFLENSTMWNFIAESLAKKNRVICIDLLGHGNSACIGYIHTMTDMALAVKEVLKLLRLRKFYIVGHSMGGYVSLALAEKYPEQIKGICLLNSTAQADTLERKKIRVRACKVAQTNYENLIKMGISNLFTETAKKHFFIEIEQVKKQALSISIQGYIGATEGMRLRENKEAVLQKIAKRLFIASVSDTVLNFQSVVAESYRTKTPLCKLDGGHMSYIEDTQSLLKYIKQFVAS
ncbi:alpha/beta hydrolase [Tenacibaculum aestuariivivum]|uniref:alpha/beta hydrolase n=1 Tax=Tenacibaculum aestuariivivum TaxID=2006131 RepID=UPI003AB83D94